jgi:hypothetical protein
VWLLYLLFLLFILHCNLIKKNVNRIR